MAFAAPLTLAALALGAGGLPPNGDGERPEGADAPGERRFVPFGGDARTGPGPREPILGGRSAATGERRGRASEARRRPARTQASRAPAPPRVRDRSARAAGGAPAGGPASHGVVRLRRGVALRSGPGGRVVARVGARTEFGSPRVFGVARSRGAWLGVMASALPNGRLGWIRRADPAVALDSTTRSLHVDLSRRRLVLRDGRRRVRTVTVAVGRAAHPTPSGRFAVTDKLIRLPAAYGCCALALSGHQPYLPPGWPGGDRLAIHGTSAAASIGTASSTGCLRAGELDMRALLRLVPLGAPVFVRP